MKRLDLYLYENGFVKSRQKAKLLIEDGYVRVNSLTVKKPSYVIDTGILPQIEIFDPCPYVSRGALKLEKAVVQMNLDINDKICVDIGASTGGFTDYLIKHGANKVYAVDSGKDQLDESLRLDPRVVSIEGYNARNICIDDIGEKSQIVTMDVSFISQTYIIPRIPDILEDGGSLISLIKPQFEVGKAKLGKGGIVKKAEYRLEAVTKVIDCAKENNLNCVYFDVSPIVGGDGNIEFLAMFNNNTYNTVPYLNIKNIVMKK